MEPKYDHKKIEKQMSEKWDRLRVFEAKVNPNKKPYTIVLPPPNASGKMHVGNALMIAIEDILIRWKKMQGFETLWLPGTDHAGFETQTTYERELKKQNKSRFNFDRETLYKDITTFVMGNKSAIEEQIKSMGAGVDWSRYTFTLDPRSIKIVTETFKKMEADGLVYRSDYVVNYSFKWGTTFSDAEIVMREQKDPLYYIKFGPLTVATVRPESKLGDTALAVNPNDPRYQKYIGTFVEFDDVLGKNRLKVIADPYVDPDFGTGVLKVTPAHSKDDYELGLKHGLEIKNVIELNGRMTADCGKYAGLKVLECRKAIVEDLQTLGLLEKVDDSYVHLVPVDYRTEDYIEQLVLPNWFVRVDHPKFSLKNAAAKAVETGALTIYPKWQEGSYTRWVENMRDWAISRQVVWGIRIPAWYNAAECAELQLNFMKEGKVVNGRAGELLKQFSYEEIEQGLQTLIAPRSAKYVISVEKPTTSGAWFQDTDTFDTWFSSGQWPLITLGYPNSEEFKYFYPTSVLETGWEIITRWVSRMVMFGLYLTGEVPFKDVYLHGRVMAVDGKKMSKSVGNVVNPEEYQETYGTDALRMGLISGTANGKDFAFPKDKVLAYRNFANKIWNMGRFILGLEQDTVSKDLDQEVVTQFKEVVKSVDANLEKYRFSDAADAIYQFMWHFLADDYIERVKKLEGVERARGIVTLRFVYLECLKLLHPFMPFVTEAIWEGFSGVDGIEGAAEGSLVLTTWPSAE